MKTKHIKIAGSRNIVRYSIYSGDPDGYFSIDPTSGNIRIANVLDHETKPQVLLNIQATSGEPPVYGHTQVITYNTHITCWKYIIFIYTKRDREHVQYTLIPAMNAR